MNTPTFKIVNGKVVEQPRMIKPEIESFSTRGQETPDYKKALTEYEAHVNSLREYTCSPELKQQFEGKDVELVEGKNFEFRTICNGRDCTCEEISDWYNCDYNEDRALIAYPISSTTPVQESQEVLWEDVVIEFPRHLLHSEKQEFIEDVKKLFTIQRKQS